LTSVQCFIRVKGIYEMESRIKDEPRWPPALAILAVLFVMIVLPHHVLVMPIWISRFAGLAVLVPMAAVALTTANTQWLRIERTMIMLSAVAYIANTIVELADMIGIITLHPPESRPISLLSSSVAIWMTNVLTFSLAVLANRSGRPIRLGERAAHQAGLALSASGDTRGRATQLAAIFPRLSLSWIQHGDSVQPHRRLAAYPSRQNVDDDREHDLALDDRPRRGTRRQRSSVVEGTMRAGGSVATQWSHSRRAIRFRSITCSLSSMPTT
jgi:hypothetical protein